MPSLAIIAALPRELSLLSRNLAAHPLSRADGVLVESAILPGSTSRVLLITAGMGATRVSRAVSAALAHGPVHTLLSVGLAGACDPHRQPGTLVAASTVIDSRSGERFAPTFPLPAIPSQLPSGVLVTVDVIAGAAEKQRLHQSYAAVAVDMEAATVARLATAHGIPFAALKAISDEHDLDLSHLAAFATPHGRFRTGAFALHTALRPARWRAAASLGRNSKAALQSLSEALRQIAISNDPGPA